MKTNAEVQKEYLRMMEYADELHLIVPTTRAYAIPEKNAFILGWIKALEWILK